jgi:signal peptidase I
MRARRVGRLLWLATGLVLALVVVKSFVADVYRVDSGSMRPTLFGGRARPDGPEEAERVLVRYGGGAPGRFDLVVVRSPDGGEPLVKRVCGLPGDQDLMIRDGDLLVDRARLGPEVPRPPLVPVYDDRHQDPNAFFEHARDGSVRREGDAWVVEGEGRPHANVLDYHLELRDDALDRRHQRVPGVIEVNDACLALEFALDPPHAGATLVLHLTEEGDQFGALLEVRPDGGTSARLTRLNRATLSGPDGAVHPERELARVELATALEPGRFVDLTFSNVDNHLALRSLALGLVLEHIYEANASLHENGGASAGDLPRHLGPRAAFGVHGARARFRGVRVLRDLFYTEDGRFGVRAGHGRAPAGGGEVLARDDALSLGPDDYFLLGDNSAASTDSRHFGPRKADELLGRPLFVVWPRLRWLRATEER